MKISSRLSKVFIGNLTSNHHTFHLKNALKKAEAIHEKMKKYPMKGTI